MALGVAALRGAAPRDWETRTKPGRRSALPPFAPVSVATPPGPKGHPPYLRFAGYNVKSRGVSVRPGAGVPDLKTLLLICAVLLWAGVQYGLMVWALRDLRQRSRVRGDNKVLWGLLILIVPILGALLYSIAAPVAPIARPPRLIVPQRRLATHDDSAA